MPSSRPQARASDHLILAVSIARQSMSKPRKWHSHQRGKNWSCSETICRQVSDQGQLGPASASAGEGGDDDEAASAGG